MAEFDAIVARMPEIRKPQLAGMTGYVCSVQKSSDIAAFFETKSALIPGYERSLAQGVERAQLCSALKTQKALDVKNAFQ